MPPTNPLPESKRQLIRLWILQGGLDEDCGEMPCETENVTFSVNILPIIQNNCQGCHSGTDPAAGLSLLSYRLIVMNVIALQKLPQKAVTLFSKVIRT